MDKLICWKYSIKTSIWKYDFRRQRPPTIADDDMLRKKIDMLLARRTRLYLDLTYTAVDKIELVKLYSDLSL